VSCDDRGVYLEVGVSDLTVLISEHRGCSLRLVSKLTLPALRLDCLESGNLVRGRSGGGGWVGHGIGRTGDRVEV